MGNLIPKGCLIIFLILFLLGIAAIVHFIATF